MKLVTFNVNGIRAALNKGLADWVKEIDADIMCFQEIKLSETHLVEPIFTEMGYNCYWYPAQKKGYSGVGIISKEPAIEITKGINIEEYDNEGRTILASYKGFNVICSYFPSGTTGDIRQDVKIRYLSDFENYALKIKESGIPLIVCGDVNICHTEIDIHNPKTNAKTSGFLPEERAWVSQFLSHGFTDSFRHINKEPHNYSWWSYRAGSRGKNLGWRIDYIFTANLPTENILNAHIHSDVVMSDHCPVSIDFKI